MLTAEAATATLLAAETATTELFQHLLTDKCCREIDVERLIPFVLDQHVSAERVLRDHFYFEQVLLDPFKDINVFG